MRYLLDTNILIALSKNSPLLPKWLAHYPTKNIFLSSVVLAEIEYGIAKSQRREYNRQTFDLITQAFQVIEFDVLAAKQYGLLRADLERQGKVIGSNDMFIAAQALAADLILVTDNEREFRRIPQLKIENWIRE